MLIGRGGRGAGDGAGDGRVGRDAWDARSSAACSTYQIWMYPTCGGMQRAVHTSAFRRSTQHTGRSLEVVSAG